MKSKYLPIALLFSIALFCQAQDKDANTQPAPATTPGVVVPDQPQATGGSGTTIPTPAPMAAGALSSSYVIGPDDSISVIVWKEGGLSGNLLVRPDGMITMPLLGDIQAAGLKPTELANVIKGKLGKYVQDPLVEVVVVAVKSKQIFLMGEVGRKGPVDMTPGMTLLQAMGIAGLTDYANTKHAYILRDEDGKRTKIPIHYKEALKGNQQYDIPLKAGDTIVVP